MNVHASKFSSCRNLLEKIGKLRGKKMTEFLDEVSKAYDFDTPDTLAYLLPPPPLLEALGECGTFYLRCVLRLENK
jgi:hypothetical protein